MIMETWRAQRNIHEQTFIFENFFSFYNAQNPPNVRTHAEF